jgi:hypothetical protein
MADEIASYGVAGDLIIGRILASIRTIKKRIEAIAKMLCGNLRFTGHQTTQHQMKNFIFPYDCIPKHFF